MGKENKENKNIIKLISIEFFKEWYEEDIEDTDDPEIENLISRASLEVIAQCNTGYSLIEDFKTNNIPDDENYFIQAATVNIVGKFFEMGVDKSSSSTSSNFGAKSLSYTITDDNSLQDRVYNLLSKTRYYQSEFFGFDNDGEDSGSSTGQFKTGEYLDQTKIKRGDKEEGNVSLLTTIAAKEILIEKGGEKINKFIDEDNAESVDLSKSFFGILAKKKNELAIYVKDGWNTSLKTTAKRFVESINEVFSFTKDNKKSIDITNSNLKDTNKELKKQITINKGQQTEIDLLIGNNVSRGSATCVSILLGEQTFDKPTKIATDSIRQSQPEVMAQTARDTHTIFKGWDKLNLLAMVEFVLTKGPVGLLEFRLVKDGNEVISLVEYDLKIEYYEKHIPIKIWFDTYDIKDDGKDHNYTIEIWGANGVFSTINLTLIYSLVGSEDGTISIDKNYVDKNDKILQEQIDELENGIVKKQEALEYYNSLIGKKYEIHQWNSLMKSIKETTLNIEEKEGKELVIRVELHFNKDYYIRSTNKDTIQPNGHFHMYAKHSGGVELVKFTSGYRQQISIIKGDIYSQTLSVRVKDKLFFDISSKNQKIYNIYLLHDNSAGDGIAYFQIDLNPSDTGSYIKIISIFNK